MPRKRRAASRHVLLLRANRHRYEELLETQGGGCALCGRPPKTRKLDLDHDHGRMVVRGLLCVRCNRALVSWMTREWLLAAAEYVGRTA